MFEPKWDGFRSIIFRDGGDVEIGSRNGKPLTRYFPELVEALKANLPPRCVLDGEIILVGASGDRLDFDALQQRIHPAASRVRLLAEQTPAQVCRIRSAGPRRRGPHRAALRRAARGAGTRARRECCADPPHRRDPGQGNGREMVPPVRGGRPRRDRGQAAGRAVPAGQALHVQGQARTHRRLRPRRVPGAHFRPGPDRFTAAGPLRRRRRTRQRGCGGGLPAAAPQGTLRGTPAARDQFRGPPLGLGPAGGGGPDAAQCRGQPVERGQGPLLHPAPAGACGGGEIRPHGRRTVPPHDAVRPLAPGPGPAFLHLRPARGAGQVRSGARCWAPAGPDSGAPARLLFREARAATGHAKARRVR